MSSKWRIIDCTNLRGCIVSNRGSIRIESSDGAVADIPVADVAVVLVGMEVQFSAAVMHRLMEADVSVLICDWRGVPEGAAFSWSQHGRVGARASAQASLTVPRAKNAWGRIVKAKIAGQTRVLNDRGILAGRELGDLVSKVRSGDPDNIEARAARIYWSAASPEPGFKRDPRGLHTPSNLNSCLDYAYTIVRGYGIQAVLGAGLTPSLGIFHRGRGNNFALVDDLIEPFRPAVDDGVFSLSDTDMRKPSTRAEVVKIASRTFASDGKTISSVFSDFARQFGRYVENEVEFLQPPVWTGGTLRDAQ